MDDTSKKSELAVRRVVWGRQFLASTVVVPPDVAEHLNTDAMAVLAVIRNEAQASGKCSLPVARIAERANIGRAAWLTDTRGPSGENARALPPSWRCGRHLRAGCAPTFAGRIVPAVDGVRVVGHADESCPTRGCRPGNRAKPPLWQCGGTLLAHWRRIWGTGLSQIVTTQMGGNPRNIHRSRTSAAASDIRYGPRRG